MDAKKIGIVAIGRNEGERLKRCLKSLKLHSDNIVYVDSGSTDDSVEFANKTGVDVFELDMDLPFSAGRARNEGFKFIVNKRPSLQYVQFIDGDCELCEKWIETATKYLDYHSSCAVVCGRRLEIYPQNSIYNLLCDIEWNTPTGTVNSCGGDFLARTSSFHSIGGFNPEIIAGEEPEMCYRLRQKGWGVQRLKDKMTLHDAEMYRFSQWWYRMIRSGHAYAQGAAIHGTGSEKFCLKDCLRIWFWALLLPLNIVALTFILNSSWSLLFLFYPIQFLKIAVNKNKQLSNFRESTIYALFVVLGKWPQLYGQLKFLKNYLFNFRPTIIEYK